MAENMKKKNKHLIWTFIAIAFSALWITQWMLAAYTLDARFAYGGFVTLLAIGVIAIALDVTKDYA